MAQSKRILCVGLVCLDIISVVEKYPEEDTDTRCVSQRWQRGGNASNSCTVLSLLGAQAAFMGSLAHGPVADFILEDFQKFHIDVSMVTAHAQCDHPTSTVICNVSTGSRTILHMNSFIVADLSRCAVDSSSVCWVEGQTPVACCLVCQSGTRTVILSDTNLPDVTAEDFSKVDLSQFSWIHWEGRNASEQVKMIQQVQKHNSSLPREQRISVSVEIEKTRETLYQLFDQGDVVFVSKDVARHFGFSSAEEALRGMYCRVKPGAVLVCAWAECGAGALGPDGCLLLSESFPPESLVDTLGAGDTFNSAVIYTLSNGGSVQEALTFGCRVAGAKCGFHGYDDIAGKFGEKETRQ